MLQYKPETIETFEKLYSERKDTIEYLEKFGNRFEKAQAMLIKEVAGMRNGQNTRAGRRNSRGHLSSQLPFHKGED